jgi:hypothetical protein
MIKRSGYWEYRGTFEFGKTPLKIWGYDKRNRYVGRIEITAAGLAAYTGKKGGKRIANLNWEGFFKRLQSKR